MQEIVDTGPPGWSTPYLPAGSILVLEPQMDTLPEGAVTAGKPNSLISGEASEGMMVAHGPCTCPQCGSTSINHRLSASCMALRGASTVLLTVQVLPFAVVSQPLPQIVQLAE